MRKTASENENVHPSLDLAQHQAPHGRKTLFGILHPPFPLQPRVTESPTMLIKKNFIFRSDARTSQSPRKFSRANIRDGTREVPFFE
jgi:hypothetical protein